MDAFERERRRLSFVEQRDGILGAMAFARQGLYVYRSALAERNQGGNRLGYGFAFRRELVISCTVFRRYLREPENQTLQGLVASRPLLAAKLGLTTKDRA